MPGRRTTLLLPLLGGLLLSCAELPTIEENRCGNGFVEPGEDCEGFEGTAKGATCNPPGAENQCRYHCADDDQCQSSPVSSKGSGWRCGADSVCRRPLGDGAGQGTFFAPVSSLVPGSADDLLSGDFDGDKRKDVLAVGQAGFDIHYFTRDGGVAKSLSVRTAPVIPAIGKLTLNTADDFTLDVGKGIGVMLGQTGQTVTPTSYLSFNIEKKWKNELPWDVRLFLLDTGVKKTMSVEFEGSRPMALASFSDDVQILDASRINPDDDDDPKLVLATLEGFGKKTLLGTIPVDYLKVDSLKEGDHLQRFAFAYRGEKGVPIFNGAAKDPLESIVALPTDVTVHGAAFFVDVNGDALLDLLVGGARCKSPLSCPSAEIDVAYGDGKGGFFSTPPSMGVGDPAALNLASTYLTASPKDPVSSLEIEQYLPLAVGHLNSGPQIDFVNAMGIFVSNDAGTSSCSKPSFDYCRVEEPSAGGAWSEAKIGNLNANGFADVVAVSAGTKSIDFFNGTGTDIFNTFSLPAEGVPRSLSVGDFDGDLVDDLAFDSVTSAFANETHTLFVAFGRPSGAPELPLSMGTVPKLHQIVPGDIRSFGDDAAADILLLSGDSTRSGDDNTTIEQTTWNAGLSLGNGYRQLQAPLVFFTPGTINIESVPLASAIGNFAPDPSVPGSIPPHLDLASVILQPKSTSSDVPICNFDAVLWLLPATDDANIAPPNVSSKKVTIPTSSPTGGILPIRPLMEAVPINADSAGLDELLITVPAYTTCAATPAKLGAHGELYLARFNPADGTPELTQVNASLGANDYLVHVQVGDIDGDDHQDIAAIRVQLNPELNVPVKPTVVVLRGDGKGGFGPALEVSIPGYPTDLVLVNADGEGDLELAVAVNFVSNTPAAGLFVIDWDRAATDPKSAFKTVLPRTDDPLASKSGLLLLDAPKALAGGDFDGDGVDDVAVAGAGGIRLLRGIAR